MRLTFHFAVAFVFAIVLSAQAAQAFDGSPWNLSTGNLSVSYIQASPIGSHPRTDNFHEAPPPIDELKKLKAQGLVAYEDYIAWGAVEREPGKWNWSQHDAIEKACHEAGLKYVAYCWVHFPPKWLRDQQNENRTLMRCLEHDQECNYLSIFDPKTIEHYDHFYKALAAHFGGKIDGVYACILGPYGEGNYPLYVPDWVDMGHCHEGYWCGDDFARKAFGGEMPKISPSFKPSPGAFKTPQQRRDWVNFIAWYHQSLIDFAGKSIETTLKYFPKEKVKAKPGGNAGGVNPIPWGTYCPLFAKMAQPLGVCLQPADWRGAYFGDKWVATAYQFYNVPLGTEPAGGLDHAGMLQSLYSDACCGAKQIFVYEFPQHASDIQKYAHLVTGKPSETQVAVFCPTTLYRLGGDLSPTIKWSHQLRDLTDYDVLDELLIADGALKFDKYKILVLLQSDYIDQPILDRIETFLHAGGTVLINGSDAPENLDGKPWKPALDAEAGKIVYAGGKPLDRFKKIADPIRPIGYDGVADGIWSARRGDLTLTIGANKPDKITAIERVAISDDEKGFVLKPSGKKFIPWGFNYDRNNEGGLLESYWHEKWDKVVEDFGEMKQLGANVVRIHLQFGKFMDSAVKPNEQNFAQLEKLVRLAEQTGLYLDLTGLACYRKEETPGWYDDLDESARWKAHARFWEEVARRCADRPGVFFYDLMNEPVSPNEKRAAKDWLAGPPFAGYYFVQFIALDPQGRSRDEMFKAWVKELSSAIRKHDKAHPITVGMLPFAPGDVARDLDFLCVHDYPTHGKVDDALKIVKAFDYGKPVVIEEMFPLSCTTDDLADFVKRSKDVGAAGWIGFYWGKTPAELKPSTQISDQITLSWLELFQKLDPNR